jgi:two-component system NtrC family sensor kinase
MSPEASRVGGDQSVEQLKRELDEAREQQAATAEILRVILSSPMDLRRVFAEMAASAARLCDAFDATVFQVDGEFLRLVAHAGPIPQAAALPLARGFVTGRVVLDRRTVHLADVQAEIDEYPEGSDSARRLGHHTILAVPLIRASEAIGAITMRRTEVRPFTERQIDLLTTFANQAVIAIENTRLFEEVQARNQELIETSEILRVISSSPTNTQPTFDAIAQSATRLCDAVNGIVLRYDGVLLHLAAHHNLVRERLEAVERVFPRLADRGSVAGRVVMSSAVVHVEDISTDPEYLLPIATMAGYRSVLGVPMLRGGVCIGAIIVARDQVVPFSDKQIELAQNLC